MKSHTHFGSPAQRSIKDYSAEAENRVALVRGNSVTVGMWKALAAVGIVESLGCRGDHGKHWLSCTLCCTFNFFHQRHTLIDLYKFLI